MLPGSPPQVRGKHSTDELTPEQIRITPAGAGKTQIAWARKIRARDHPRRCGENLVQCVPKFIFKGSPPQVRGKLTFDSRKRYDLRITPAGAGKTTHKQPRGEGGKDHPRRCGENQYGEQESDWDMGSPPQVRGKRLPPYCGANGGGITPAGAGKTVVFDGDASYRQDHPRRCGENPF